MSYLKQNLTLGNVVMIATLFVSLVIGWSELKNQAKDNSQAITNLKGSAAKDLQEVREAVNKDISKIKEDMNKTDAKLDLLSKELGEIKSSLRSMETNIAWIVRQDKRDAAR